MFIDIHSHLLPGVDDGAKTIDEALYLLKQAEEDGIEYVVLTPHYIKNGEFRLKKEEIVQRYQEFKDAVVANGIDIKLLLGNELYIHKDLDDLLINNEICSLNNTSYVLIEFPFDKYKEEYDEYLYNIALSGYRIVIAHPERYGYVQNNIDFCKRWIKEGYYLQVNQNSLFNQCEKTVMKLIGNKWVSFVASDAHNEYRPCNLSKAFAKIMSNFGEEVANDLFCENQYKLLLNEKNII
ncbi:MAG: CpsB/CapC family capsule biosynthesis tyrosine phosphatase [Erysipelotrichaceae bacterium]|nr:CpsB/CapC family capsule biosynthesis tyrosine phosphatase [Erysipelotrichaceae bacterium]